MFVPVEIVGGHIDIAPIERLGSDVENMTEPLRAVGQRLLAAVGEQFRSEGLAGGEPWLELTENYRSWKEQKVPGLPKLIGVERTSAPGARTDTYARSGATRKKMLDPAAVVVTPQQLVYSPDSEVAYFHQVGTPRMVARPPVAFPLAEIEQWDTVFVAWLDRLIEEMG